MAGSPSSSLAEGVIVIGDVVLHRRVKLRDVGWVPPRGVTDIDGTAFDAFADSEGERLESVNLIVADPEIAGTSWTDWRGDRAGAFPDAFLAERFGRGHVGNGDRYPYGSVEYRMPWGTLGSYLPRQDQWARITLFYAKGWFR